MRSRRDVIDSVEASAIRSGFSLDPGQRRALDHLADVGVAVSRSPTRRSTSQGLYLHGDTGRGKTWLADTFHAVLPTTHAQRVHFHGFLDDLHRGIHDHRTVPHAVARAIDDVIGSARLLFFDELHVHDSGDAQLLTRLLEHAFRRKVIVIATSNYAPDDLLPNPIWHHTFASGIELIKQNMVVHHLSGATDYRAARKEQRAGFASGSWTTSVSSVLPSHGAATPLTVRGRDFPMIAVSADELRASFAQLCQASVSTIEYLEWSRRYCRWTITDVPSLDDVDREAQQRFINLVDVLADADIPVTFVSVLDLGAFLGATSARPDASRMMSRLQLLRRGC